MPKNVILYGSSGTGKTLLLVECVKMKVSQYERNGKPLKIIISTYISDTKQLIQDLKEKYNLEYLKEKHDITFANINDLSEGRTASVIL